LPDEWLSVAETWDLSPLPVPKKPTGIHSQDRCEGLNLIVEHTAVVILDLGNRGPIELNADPRKPA
jgi:hypothetical protein